MTDDGIRPVVDESCAGCGRCVDVCPGADTSHGKWDAEADREFGRAWGPVLDIWEGHAADPEIRFRGSSGGAASALALYCLEKEGMYATIHAGADKEEPHRNRTRLSKNREELLETSGSRYSPASPCDGFGVLEAAPSPCVFIGKPCDVAALRKAQSISDELDSRAGLAISIFCAGTPSTRGTLDLLERFNKQSLEVETLRYRGNGWPGNWTAETKSGPSSMPYKDAWSFLQKYRPLRCHLCPDGTGEFADISCGDPWYREITPGEPGLSLIVTRTAKGRRVLKAAADSGYLKIKKIDPALLEKSQLNLLQKRRAVWGRLAALKLLLIPVPKLRGFSLFHNWASLSFFEKLRSLAGTLRRAMRREYYRRARAFPVRNIIKDISIIRKRGAI
jgi:coenzyme F420 hydrogenase subunit beta